MSARWKPGRSGNAAHPRTRLARSDSMPATIFVRSLAAALLLAALAACSATSILNVLSPTGDLDIRRDVAYGTLPRQKLDIYRPKAGAVPRPVVVFFYGGSWDSGSRDGYLFVGEALASRGFVAVVPDYRVHPEVVFPTFLEDAAAAVAWAKRNAGDIGGDPSRVFVMGHSAGAHIAAMVALDPRYLAREGLTPLGALGLHRPRRPLRLPAAQERDPEAHLRPRRDDRAHAADQLRERRRAPGAAGHGGKRFDRVAREFPAARGQAARERRGRDGAALSVRSRTTRSWGTSPRRCGAASRCWTRSSASCARNSP